MSAPARRVLTDEERVDWLRLSRTAQVGPITFFGLIARYGSAGVAITARMALEQGREVFAVPGSPLDPRAQGTNGLIRDGAALTESADDVLRVLTAAPISRRQNPQPPLPLPGPAGEPELDDARKVILEALSPVPVAVDELVRDCQVSLPVVLTILLELELAGRLERQAGQRVSLVP